MVRQRKINTLLPSLKSTKKSDNMPTSTPNFEALIAEAEKAGFSGWDFSYLEGRYKESAPSWDYARWFGTHG